MGRCGNGGDGVVGTTMGEANPECIDAEPSPCGILSTFALWMMWKTYAAINECVDAAKCQPNGLGAAKLVNGVLRRCDRERSAIRKALAEESEAVRFSHPAALLSERWQTAYGVERGEPWWIGIIARHKPLYGWNSHGWRRIRLSMLCGGWI